MIRWRLYHRGKLKDNYKKILYKISHRKIVRRETGQGEKLGNCRKSYMIKITEPTQVVPTAFSLDF